MAISIASISKTQRASKPPRVVIHGAHGVGKTTLAARAYAPIFLPTEDGLDGIDGVAAFPILTSFDEVISAIQSLREEEHEYGTAVIDSLDWLEPLIHKRVAASHGVDTITDIEYGRGFVEALGDWRQLLRALEGLRDERGMAVILIAHSEIKRFDQPGGDGYDRYQIKLHKAASAMVQEWADIIGFAAWRVITTTEEKGFGAKRTVGKSTGERLLHTEERPAYIAKNRYGLPATLPLDWGSLMSALQGEIEKEKS